MGTPSSLGELGYGVTAVFPLSTSTAIFHIRTSDTGTVATTVLVAVLITDTLSEFKLAT